MKERPVIFNSEMVRAILSGGKRQTRRVMKPQVHSMARFADYKTDLGYPTSKTHLWAGFYLTEDSETPGYYKCPYGKIGDRLWVRETWSTDADIEAYRKANEPVPIVYKGDWDIDGITKEEACDVGIIWKPSIFMPRWASRIDLEITDIGVERVQDIKEKDCEAEGIEVAESIGDYAGALWTARTKKATFSFSDAQSAFQYLWDSINAKRGYGWDSNPWVWIIMFKRVIQ